MAVNEKNDTFPRIGGYKPPCHSEKDQSLSCRAGKGAGVVGVSLLFSVNDPNGLYSERRIAARSFDSGRGKQSPSWLVIAVRVMLLATVRVFQPAPDEIKGGINVVRERKLYAGAGLF